MARKDFRSIYEAADVALYIGAHSTKVAPVLVSTGRFIRQDQKGNDFLLKIAGAKDPALHDPFSLGQVISPLESEIHKETQGTLAFTPESSLYYKAMIFHELDNEGELRELQEPLAVLDSIKRTFNNSRIPFYAIYSGHHLVYGVNPVKNRTLAKKIFPISPTSNRS